jgi:TRAP-type C4-dicarboxylate transport system substrate-binding protein
MQHVAGGLAVTLGLGWAAAAAAADVQLRVMHFLPATAPAQTQLIEPWAQAIEEQSGGRISVQIFPAMQLGGRPPQLIDQVRDGIVDVVWTLPSYTPGRFPKISVFELPFMISDAVATSKAVQEYYEAHAQDEFADVHPLLFHVHARGLVHTNGKPIEKVEDFSGLQLRAPSRPVGDALAAYGATPIFLPVPQLAEAISKNVIDGAVVPWEVTVPLRLFELTDHHTEIPGERGLYTAVFLFAMNKQVYEGLPDDLKQVIDDNSGMNIAGQIGEAWETAEEPGRTAAEERGNTIITLPEAEVERLQELAAPVTAAWVAEMDQAGLDGDALLAAAQELLEKHGTSH